ncbi:MAG: propanediol utilization protein [Pseudomonadota bacterium]
MGSRAPFYGSAEGHFGEFLQGRLGPDGPVALITLPTPGLRTQAIWQPSGPFALHAGAAPPVTAATARRLIAALAEPVCARARGRLRLHSAMPAGAGAGASTAALVAIARAVRAAQRGRLARSSDLAVTGSGARPPGAEGRLAALCLALEGASDPVMFEQPEALLWASRQARVLRPLPAPPAFDAVGALIGPPERTDPRDEAFADIADLVTPWVEASAQGDRQALGRIASESARRNAAHRGARLPEALEALVRETGALGLASAHTGPARALLFAPGQGAQEQARAALWALGASAVYRFSTARHGRAVPHRPLDAPARARHQRGLRMEG